MSEREVVERIVRAALRETPGPYRLRLALAEWERVQQEKREAELAAMAAFYGVEGDR